MGTFSAAVREGLAEEVTLEQGPGWGEKRGPWGRTPAARTASAKVWRPESRAETEWPGRGARGEGGGPWEDLALTREPQEGCEQGRSGEARRRRMREASRRRGWMGHVGPVEAGGMGSFCSSWSMSFSGLGAWPGLALVLPIAASPRARHPARSLLALSIT